MNHVSTPPLDFRLLFESSPNAFLVLSPTLEVVAVSDLYLNITSTKREEILGKDFFHIFPDNPLHPGTTGEGKKDIRTSLKRVLDTKKTDIMESYRHDLRHPSKGRFEERHWSSTNSPILNSQGEILYIVRHVQDVTAEARLKKLEAHHDRISEQLRMRAESQAIEIHRNEERMRQLDNELAESHASLARKEKELALTHELKLRKQELQKALDEMSLAKDEALKASKVKSQFLANISHEIRTPLGIILGFAEMLENESLTPTERKKYISRIQTNGQSLFKLLNEILDLTKLDSGKMDVEQSAVSLAELTNEVVSFLEPWARGKGMSIQGSLSRKVPPFLYTDHGKLRQILINLLSNAIKFSQTGDVALRVELNHTRPSSQVKFIVKDNGVGISSEYLDHLFESFSQADSSMSRKTGGNGLGLALSRRLARILGGDVELVETGSQGSTFCLHLPLQTVPKTLFAKTEKRSEKKFEQQQDSTALDNIKILLVDDSPDNLFLVRYFLEKMGAQVETASNGKEGVGKALAHHHDLVIMDVQMPQLNGYDATSSLRAKGYRKPIVALTANALKEDRDKCIQSGCSDYLLKPVVAPQLIKAIRRNLSLKPLQNS